MKSPSLRAWAGLALGLIGSVFAATSLQAQRNAWSWPFASDSIWNLPLGTSANYGWLGLGAEQTVDLELEYIVYTDASTPLRPVYYPGSPYRASGTTRAWLAETRVPNWFIVADVTLNPYSTPNACAAFVYAPTGAVTEMQPTTRLSSTGPIWGYPATGQTIYGQGEKGSHYGSGLSTLGGSIRSGELTSSQPIRHALKVLMQGSKHIYRGTPNGSGPRGFGWKWPADRADNYAQNAPASGGYGGTNPELAMGSLLAIPGWVDVSSLGIGDARARKIAQAMKDYGAYLVDDTAYPSYSIACSQEEQAAFNAIPKADLMKVMRALWVVTNTSPTQKKGPGVPRAATAPGF